MAPRLRTSLIALSLGLALSAACGGDDGRLGADNPYDEGRVRIEIELLDTGLLKGHAYADANEGWIVASTRVEAVAPGGTKWPVIEPERTGLGSPNAVEFFEVTLQELPRGEQIAVTATVVFEDPSGQTIERAAQDQWPP